MYHEDAPVETVGETDTVEAAVEDEIVRMVPSGFAVRDAPSASWVVRHVLEARRYAERVRQWAAAEQRRADAEERRFMWLFGQQLRCWTEAEIEKVKGRRKSIALPGGTVGMRHVSARLVVQNEPAVLAWARTACPAAVVTTERLAKTPITLHFEQTGEVPPGVVVAPAETTFFIR